MRDEVNIKRLTSFDSYKDEILKMHQKIFEGTLLENILIYFDTEYYDFLDILIKDKNNYFFIALRKDTEVVGFVHLKDFGEELFLNNIFISESYQGWGVGKKVLRDCLDYFDVSRFEYFGLDVFRSNTIALKWYERIGLEEKSSKSWNKIISIKEKLEDNNTIVLVKKKDPNGFNSYFLNDKKLATVINDDYIILHEIYEEILFYFLSKTNYSIITNCKINNKSYQIVELEDSIRMRGEFCMINNLLKN